MTEANEMYETVMRELSSVVISDTGDSEEEQGSFTLHEETISDDFPPSLLSYFETSKSRAAVCEKFILEEPKDFTASHHTEDTMNLPYELDGDMMRLNKKVTSETENEENNSFADTHLLPTPTETEALSTLNLSVYPSNDDEAEDLDFKVRTPKSSMKEEAIRKSTEYQREKQHCEEMKKQEQRRQRERDFQEELRKIIEAEKLHQKELELMEKRAQEKLEQEFLLQQELINNLQKRVEKERKMREEEQKRIKEEREREMKEEEDKRKREEDDRRKREETIKKEMERKKQEEEVRRKRKEDEEMRKIEEMRIKEKDRRKKEEQREKEEEEKRMEKVENREKEQEKNKVEENMKEEERAIKEIRLKEEEKRKQVEGEEGQKDKNEEKIKEREKNRKREDEEDTRKREEEKKMTDVEMKKMMEEDNRKKNEEEIGLKKEGRDSDDEDKRREEEVRTKREEIIKEEETKSEEETKAEVEKKMLVEQMKRREEENREREEMKLREDEEKIKKDEERRRIRMEEEEKTEEEERRKWQEEVMRQQREEEEHSNTEEEVTLRKEKELDEAHEADDMKMEHERKPNDKEKRQEEVKKQHERDMRKREDGRRNVEADKRQITKDVRKNKEEDIKTEERRLRKEEENNKIIVQDAEKEGRLTRANELQERKTGNESKNTENIRSSLTSQPEDGTTLTSSSPGPSLSDSTASPTSSDLNRDTSQTSTCKSMGRQDAAVKPCTSSSCLPACLPEHTEQKRLSWMTDCVPWSKLSLQNRRKQKGCVRGQRGLRRAPEASSLPPLCPRALLQSTGCKSLQEVTTVTLEDLPGCSLSTLAQCTHLQSLTVRRCGLKSLEGIKQLPQLCYIDVQENDISFVDCENMTSLRVLRLGHNKLTSIHGLSGAEHLNVLDLSHNSITRIAGLEFMRRLQRLSVDHNQLISTKGLRDVYTLLHLDCSHNHLASVEGLENSALLQTLDLRANSLTEAPSLNNHILLRELHLDDNSISSLQGLAVCWLPLMHHFSVAQNRITLLPSMSDFVSLASLDLRFNCMSELQNVCESLEGCQFLREVHLTGNPFQQESGWRSTLQRAVAGLRAIDGRETDAFMSAPAAPQVSSASGGFLTFCQAQLKQTRDLQQQHSGEFSNASSHLDALKSSCRHFTETLRLAVDQRFAHEYGDTTVSTTPEKRLDVDSTSAEELVEDSEMESTEKVPLVTPSRNITNSSYWTLEEKSSMEVWCDTLDAVTTSLKTDPRSAYHQMALVSNHQDLDLKNAAAVVIQQWWRKYMQKCGNINCPPAAEKEGGRREDGKPELEPSYINRSVVGQDCAATVIQAFWRGFALRRRLASALAAVTCPDSGEDETFEEVDVDEFVLDEAALENHWTSLLAEDSPSRGHPVSEEPLSLKPLGPFPEPSHHTLPPPPLWRPKQAWVAGEQVDSSGQRISPESSNRSKSPASSSVLSGLSARSEKILEEWGFTDSHTAHLMLKRAQKMKSKKQQQRKHKDPSVRLALFRNCNYQRGPVEARNRPAPHDRNYMKGCEAELGLWEAETTEQITQGQAEQWLHTQSDRDSESEGRTSREHFLPEISSDILNGGRVQLVADPGYTERLHHASGLWAKSNLAAQPSKDRNYPRRNCLGHARKEVPSPQRVPSAPLKKERISFRDSPVQLSGGWGGGKKRDKVYK